MRLWITLGLMACTLTGSSGCGGKTEAAHAGTLYDFSVNGVDFNNWLWTEGKTVYLRLFSAGDQAVGVHESAVVVNGAFTVVWSKTVQANTAYRVRYYVDADGSGACTADAGFSVDIAAQSAPKSFTLPAPDPDATQDVCEYFTP